jgi:hypothetical protein
VKPRVPQRSARPNLAVALIAVSVLTIGTPTETPHLASPPASEAALSAPDPCAGPQSNAIACENSLPGNPPSEWDIQGAGSESIQGFATSISVNRGETVAFKIDTPATAYHLDIYRLGYYGGNGARKVATINPSAILPQSQPACATDDTTSLLDCGVWSESASWAVPATAVSGLYIAKLVRTDGTEGSSHIVFVVRDDDGHSDLLFQTSDTTWQAYNDYGGSSLYVSPAPAGRAYKVSYNRPFKTRAANPSRWVFSAEYPMIRWLEANGYDVSYTTGVDSDRLGAELLEHRVFLSAGLDEYWSGPQRGNVEAARGAGVNLAFVGARTAFWKSRWEPSIDGTATSHRTLVSYKETEANDKIDPLSNVWTGSWRDPRFSPPADGGRPENALTGTLFAVANDQPSAIEIPAELGGYRFWRHTSVAQLQPGETAALPSGTLGTEWNETPQSAASLGRLLTSSRTQRIVSSKLIDYGSSFGPGNATHSLTMYRDPDSGSLVFSAGTDRWSWGLDTAHDGAASVSDIRMRQATMNLLADMGAQPVTPSPDLITSAATEDHTPPVSSLQSPQAGTTLHRGVSVSLQGTASDADGTVARVEVSVDGGQTWAAATGTASWSYDWTPTMAGAATILTRALDDSANLESPGAGVPVTVVVPAAGSCPCSLWSTSTVPATTDFGPDWPVELGIRFKSSTAGYITALRFYKGAGNTGTHRGTIWTGTGTRLATVAFTNESATGWQTATFETPIPIDQETTYVASYFTSVGHYAYTPNFFANGPAENGPLSAAASVNGVYRYGPDGGFPNATHFTGNYWVDVIFESTASDTTGPRILSTSPSAGAIVGPSARVVITFDEAVSESTVSAATLELRDGANQVVPAAIAHEPGSPRVVITPAAPLERLRSYTALVRGGAAGVADLRGNPLAADYRWNFATGVPPPAASDTGPGGTILVIGSESNPFSNYYREILRAEGLNAFAQLDISQVTRPVLDTYDIVVLGNIPVDDDQAAMFTAWAEAGGQLVGMRPDKRLAPLFGLTDAGGTLGDQYLSINTASGPGTGLVNQTIQFHGQADLYDVIDAQTVATLYASATTSASRPAVTLRHLANGGHAAAFTFDLARSVVYTRQGNPAWAGQERDGSAPVRANDMFWGAAGEPNWIDLAKVAIPQADEQQRLFANLLLQMSVERRPLPRFWYLPRGSKAAVVMTGDDHGSGRTMARFLSFIAASPDNCSVDDWQCVRATSYIYPDAQVTAGDVTALDQQGFEIGLHTTTGCANFTPASLDTAFSTQLAQWTARFPAIPSPSTIRTHCIPWSDWSSHASTSGSHGMRLDTNYYYWPGAWAAGRPGMFTGSGMPMRFAAENGAVLDVYQAPTQITDESGQNVPSTIAALLGRALGAEGYYGVFTANMHNDNLTSPDAAAIVDAARAVGVPVVSARQMLEWLDGRNGSTYRDLSWNDGILMFRIELGVGARGLQTMVPRVVGGKPVTSVTADGVDVAFSEAIIKGRSYAVFSGPSAEYRITYGQPVPPVTWTAPAAIPVGTALSSAQLNPASDVPGTFTFNPALGTVLPVGTHTLSAQFTPLNPGAWSTRTVTVSLTVHPIVSVLTYPANGATNVNLAQPLQWSAIPNVQAYYLYVGTAEGAKDLVDSGETQETSRLVALPAGATVYVRVWTRFGSVWRYSDSTFTAANVDSPLVSTITAPANGSTLTQATTTIQWRTIANVQAYYLYLGSSAGARNYVDTGETQATSLAVSLPAGQTVHARIWTKTGGAWRYADSSFAVAGGATSLFSMITSPSNGATGVPATATVQWTPVTNVQAYYLYIGTSPGAKDLVDSLEIQTTSKLVTLPMGQTVYARMWAKTGGIWRHTDSSFTTAMPSALAPTIIAPANNATNVATALTVLWTSVANAEAYYLYIGSSPGAKDHVNSGEIQTTSRLVSLPTGQRVYARVWARVGGIWRYSDSSFTTSGTPSSFLSTVTSPPNGATNVATGFPVQWSAVANVQAYYLYMGSSPGAKDYVDSGETLATSRLVTLPAARTIYVRMWAKVGGAWRYTDSSFTTQ